MKIVAEIIRLKLAFGRLPVKGIQEAEDMVDKLIYYSSSKTTSNWIGEVNLPFIADNGDGNIHQEDANTFAPNN